MQEPLKLDIVISFPDHGFHLRFDPWSQVLLLCTSILMLELLLVRHNVLLIRIIPFL